MKYNLQTLKNGLQIVIVPLSGIKSVTVLIIIQAGSRYEEKRINGLSHFLEHMAFKGTKKRPSALALSTLIDSIGGEFNAFTGKNHTGYYIKAASKHLPLLVDLLSDMLLNSIFSPAEIEKEKGVISEEINMYEDTPIRKVGDLYENLLYGDTPLGRDISGKKEVIKSLKREDFLSFLDRFYAPSNTIVAVVGNFNLQSRSVKQLLQKHLGRWKSKKTPKPKRYVDKQSRQAVLLRHKDTEQAHLCLGVRAYKLVHPSRYALSVLTTILGEGMSSRLFTEVREKRGLAYYIQADTHRYHDVGNFVVQAGVDVSRIENALKVILKEFRKIKQKKITEKELAKAKEYIKGRLILGLEDSKTVAVLYAVSQLLENKIITPGQIIRKVDQVTVEDVKRVAQDIFKQETLNLAIVGPYKDEEKFKNILKLGFRG